MDRNNNRDIWDIVDDVVGEIDETNAEPECDERRIFCDLDHIPHYDDAFNGLSRESVLTESEFSAFIKAVSEVPEARTTYNFTMPDPIAISPGDHIQFGDCGQTVESYRSNCDTWTTSTSGSISATSANWAYV